MNKFSFVASALLILAALAGPARAQANSCGCTQDPSSGACFCEKKARCGCPGECEPRGCQEQRDRELAKQVEIETRKAKEAARKHESAAQEDASEPTAKPAKIRPQPAAPKPVVQPVAQRNVRRLTPDQTKDLARLLSIYLHNRPDARWKTVEETYEELSIVH